MIDTHCHLDLSIFDRDRVNVLQTAFDMGITDIILPSISYNNWSAIKQLTTLASPINLHASYGLHPMFIKQHQESDIDSLKGWLEIETSIAVGECGLDFFIKDHDKERQLAFFEAQVRLACEFELPLIIHARKSLDLILKIIRKYAVSYGAIHSFSGSEQQARQLIDLGFYLGFGGPVTYPRAKKLRRLVSQLPLERLLLETDAPDQPDASHRGLRNEPAWLINIAETFAELRQDSLENIVRMTTLNAKELFSLK